MVAQAFPGSSTAIGSQFPQPECVLATIAQGGGLIATGAVVSLTGSFSGAFPIAGVVLLVGSFAYIVVLGENTPLPDKRAIGCP